MTIPNAMLHGMIRSYHGFALTDDELERVRPELDHYLNAVEKLRAGRPWLMRVKRTGAQTENGGAYEI